jgi:hypothetical protein
MIHSDLVFLYRWCRLTDITRVLIHDSYGRRKVQKTPTQRKSGFIKLTYGSRALEWLNIRQLLLDLLVFFEFSHVCPIVQDVVFAWSYLGNLSMTMYKPSSVFKKNSFIHLLDDQIQCVCSTATQLRRFCDPLTVNEHSDFCKPGAHVRTMDLDVVQHPGLCQALKQDLNHVLL